MVSFVTVEWHMGGVNTTLSVREIQQITAQFLRQFKDNLLGFTTCQDTSLFQMWSTPPVWDITELKSNSHQKTVLGWVRQAVTTAFQRGVTNHRVSCNNSSIITDVLLCGFNDQPKSHNMPLKPFHPLSSWRKTPKHHTKLSSDSI